MTEEAPLRGPGRPRKQAVPLGSTAVEPPKAMTSVVAAEPAQADAAPVPAGKRRRRPSNGGHSLKLSAPTRPGYTRHWFNDDGNRLADAHELGYDHVHEAGIMATDPGTRTSRLVGTKANGEPLRAFLMETPDELFAEGLAEKEAHNRKIDDAIAAGRDSTGQMSSTETYGQGSIQRDR